MLIASCLLGEAESEPGTFAQTERIICSIICKRPCVCLRTLALQTALQPSTGSPAQTSRLSPCPAVAHDLCEASPPQLGAACRAGCPAPLRQFLLQQQTETPPSLQGASPPQLAAACHSYSIHSALCNSRQSQLRGSKGGVGLALSHWQQLVTLSQQLGLPSRSQG